MTKEFAAVAAQVIPVIALALAIEIRYVTDRMLKSQEILAARPELRWSTEDDIPFLLAIFYGLCAAQAGLAVFAMGAIKTVAGSEDAITWMYIVGLQGTVSAPSSPLFSMVCTGSA